MSAPHGADGESPSPSQAGGLAALAREVERLLALLGPAHAEDVNKDDRSHAAGQLDVTGATLSRSVRRPLQAVVDRMAERVDGATAPGSSTGALDGPGADASDETVLNWLQGEPIWMLAREATALAAEPGACCELLEATAALQALAVTLAPTPEASTRRLQELERLQEHAPSAITVAEDGPYLVSNVGNVVDWLGQRIVTRPQMALCRCGRSASKPFCDGTHAEVGFSGAKDAGRVPDKRDSYAGEQVTILDNRGICQHSGLCTDRIATAFRAGEEPFVAPSGARMDEIIRAVRDCPSGALSYAIDGVEAREQVDRNGTREPQIEITKDGPYRVSGAIALLAANGEPQARNTGVSLEHYAMCRCGQSQNKPFCSGMHWYVDFKDPVADSEHEPSVFEWVGGLPALRRMTRLFYEKHVPQDPLLAPLFANMSPDHPERVAKWLAEVFAGPKDYSEQYGGYVRMISQHLGKGITEEKRERWVELLLLSAREAGLPNDPEFRSVFASYVEWGSRLAVENSQADSHPPEHMPMPHWDWHTAAGSPDSRVSALASREAVADAPVVLPAADEPVSFEKHVRTLFRRRDRQSMEFAFDLWDYEAVREHAIAIHERLQNGSMPCDGAWPAEKLEAFSRWVQTGMAA